MRILIYSETDAAKALQAELREAGHHASLRNPQFFNPAQFDKHCEEVFADDPAIRAAYADAGINAYVITIASTDAAPAAEPDAAAIAPDAAEPAPKRKRK